MEPKQSVRPDIHIVMHGTSSYWVQLELPVPFPLFLPNVLCLLLAILDLKGKLSISELQQFLKRAGSGRRKMISGSLKLNFPGIKRFGSFSFFFFSFFFSFFVLKQISIKTETGWQSIKMKFCHCTVWPHTLSSADPVSGRERLACGMCFRYNKVTHGALDPLVCFMFLEKQPERNSMLYSGVWSSGEQNQQVAFILVDQSSCH